jgi:hypothetical protein
MQLGAELWAEQRRAAEERRRIEALEDQRLQTSGAEWPKTGLSRNSSGRSSHGSASSG